MYNSVPFVLKWRESKKSVEKVNCEHASKFQEEVSKRKNPVLLHSSHLYFLLSFFGVDVRLPCSGGTMLLNNK